MRTFNEEIEYYKNKINTAIESNDVYKMLGELNHNEIYSWRCPIVWSIMPDGKNSKVFSSYINSAQLTLYDYDLYVDITTDNKETKKYKSVFKKKYLEYINSIFIFCLGKNHGIIPTDIWDAEVDLLNAMSCDTIKNDNFNGYNPILVIPTKALVRLKRVNEAKLKEEVSAAEKKTWKRIGEFIATHAWQITCAVIAGLLVLKFQKKLGL